MNVRRRIDLPKYFRSGSRAGDNCIFASDDSSDCTQRLRYEKIGRDVAITDVFLQRGGNRIVTVGVHARMNNGYDMSKMREGLYARRGISSA